MVEALRAEAKIEPVLVDEGGNPVAVGRTESVLSEKDKRVVKQRDGKWNLARVCTTHHPQLVELAATQARAGPDAA